MSTIKLVYWPIRGLREPIQSLLEFCGAEYKIENVTSRDTWNAGKEALIAKGFAFPNLPYIEHKGKYFSESYALLAYVAEETGRTELLPTSAQLPSFLEILGVISDIGSGLTGPAYSSKSIEEVKSRVEANIKAHHLKLESLGKLLAQQEWLMGSELSILDFKFAETIQNLLAMDEDLKTQGFGLSCLETFKAYVKKFIELPGVKAYRESDRFKERPFNNTMALWK